MQWFFRCSATLLSFFFLGLYWGNKSRNSGLIQWNYEKIGASATHWTGLFMFWADPCIIESNTAMFAMKLKNWSDKRVLSWDSFFMIRVRMTYSHAMVEMMSVTQKFLVETHKNSAKRLWIKVSHQAKFLMLEEIFGLEMSFTFKTGSHHLRGYTSRSKASDIGVGSEELVSLFFPYTGSLMTRYAISTFESFSADGTEGVSPTTIDFLKWKESVEKVNRIWRLLLSELWFGESWLSHSLTDFVKVLPPLTLLRAAPRLEPLKLRPRERPDFWKLSEWLWTEELHATWIAHPFLLNPKLFAVKKLTSEAVLTDDFTPCSFLIFASEVFSEGEDTFPWALKSTISIPWNEKSIQRRSHAQSTIHLRCVSVGHPKASPHWRFDREAIQRSMTWMNRLWKYLESLTSERCPCGFWWSIVSIRASFLQIVRLLTRGEVAMKDLHIVVTAGLLQAASGERKRCSTRFCFTPRHIERFNIPMLISRSSNHSPSNQHTRTSSCDLYHFISQYDRIVNFFSDWCLRMWLLRHVWKTERKFHFPKDVLLLINKIISSFQYNEPILNANCNDITQLLNAENKTEPVGELDCRILWLLQGQTIY